MKRLVRKSPEEDWSSHDEKEDADTQQRYCSELPERLFLRSKFDGGNRSRNLRLYINSVWVIGLTIADMALFCDFQVSRKFRHFGVEEVDVILVVLVWVGGIS